MSLWDKIVHHRNRIIVLKMVIAAVMLIAHFFPNSHVALFINLVWLFAF